MNMETRKRRVRREAAALISLPPPHSPIETASLRAARLIEAAMDACGAADLKKLDCLLDARRALSPLVDRRCPAAEPEAVAVNEAEAETEPQAEPDAA